MCWEDTGSTCSVCPLGWNSRWRRGAGVHSVLQGPDRFSFSRARGTRPSWSLLGRSCRSPLDRVYQKAPVRSSWRPTWFTSVTPPPHRVCSVGPTRKDNRKSRYISHQAAPTSHFNSGTWTKPLQVSESWQETSGVRLLAAFVFQLLTPDRTLPPTGHRPHRVAPCWDSSPAWTSPVFPASRVRTDRRTGCPTATTWASWRSLTKGLQGETESHAQYDQSDQSDQIGEPWGANADLSAAGSDIWEQHFPTSVCWKF